MVQARLSGRNVWKKEEKKDEDDDDLNLEVRR